MNKQELQNEINKTKEQLANLEKMLAECEYKRWKPKTVETYYFVDTYGRVKSEIWTHTSACDKERYNTYNCFQTREQAEAEAEKILVRRMFEDIARRLNKGEKLDWSNLNQTKYALYIKMPSDEIALETCFYSKGAEVYCLDENFKNVAIKEIGVERLKKYLRGE